VTHSWDPGDATPEDLTGIFDLSGIADGDGIIWDETLGIFVPGAPSGVGGGGSGDFYGVHVTRLSNYVLTNEDPFPFDTVNVDTDGIWDSSDPTKLTVQREGWYFLGANITTLGTDYGGASNANVGIYILRDWDGVSTQLAYYIAGERFENGFTSAAQLNSLLQLVYLEVGDVLELTLIGGAGSLLVESNPSDGVPSGYVSDDGPGTMSPHFYLVWAQTDGAAAGSTVHNDLTGRDVADAHPIEAITGLADALEAASGAGEVLMADGITPPEPLTTETEDDWLYEG
jgi:hypothetical protein